MINHDLPVVEFAFPGPLRDSLVEQVLSGSKTATTGVHAEYEVSGEPLPTVGLRQSVIDSNGSIVGVIETVGVEITRLADVSLDHALAEGEGHATVEEWRRAHERFWLSEQMLEILGAGFVVDDDTLVVLEQFKVVR